MFPDQPIKTPVFTAYRAGNGIFSRCGLGAIKVQISNREPDKSAWERMDALRGRLRDDYRDAAMKPVS